MIGAEDRAGRLRQLQHVAPGAAAEVDHAIVGADVEQRGVDRLEAVECHAPPILSLAVSAAAVATPFVEARGLRRAALVAVEDQVLADDEVRHRLDVLEQLDAAVVVHVDQLPRQAHGREVLVRQAVDAAQEPVQALRRVAAAL